MNKVWYSFCSAHQEFNSECHTCQVGHWVDEDDPEVIADHKLYQDDPDAWRAKMNHPDRKGEWLETIEYREE